MHLLMKPVMPHAEAAITTDAVSPIAAAADTVGNKSSGRYSMSTSKESSACTSGRNWSSNTKTMSCNPSTMLLSNLINYNEKVIIKLILQLN